jgi:hypothetical protein
MTINVLENRALDLVIFIHGFLNESHILHRLGELGTCFEGNQSGLPLFPICYAMIDQEMTILLGAFHPIAEHLWVFVVQPDLQPTGSKKSGPTRPC